MPDTAVMLGTVVKVDLSKGAQIRLDGDPAAGSKYYKTRAGLTIDPGDRVLLRPISGSYIVESVLGLPGQRWTLNKCPEGAQATAANCAAWINSVISALAAQGIVKKNGW